MSLVNDFFFRVAFVVLWFMFVVVRVVPSRNVLTVKLSRKERIKAMRQEGVYMFVCIVLATDGNLIAGVLHVVNPPWIVWS